jgi:hypothetical protein
MYQAWTRNPEGAVFFAEASNRPYYFPMLRNLILIVALAVSGAPAFGQTNNGVIEGRVIHASTQEGLPNVQIRLAAPPPNNATANLSPEAAARLAEQIALLIESGTRAGVSQEAIDNAIANAQRTAGGVVGAQTSVLVDNEGRFSFKDLAPGRYTLGALRDGFYGPPLNGNAQGGVSRTVVVNAGTTSSVELALTPGGIISGRVRDPNGQAVSGLSVTAYRVTFNNGRKVWSTANSKVTDDRGEYRMFWLPHGDYYVGVTPRTPGTVPGPQDTWTRTFFPGVTEPEAATLIAINKGGETTGIDINIRTASTSFLKITGFARNPYARPNAAGVVDQSINSFFLVPREPTLLDGVATTSVPNMLPPNARTNGEFEIRNVRPGSYDLIPYYLEPVTVQPVPPGTPAPPPPPRRMMFSRNPIDVRSADVTGLTLSVGPGLDLTGEVVVTGTPTAPIKVESIRLTLQPLSTTPPTLASNAGGIIPDPSGRFSVAGIPPDRYAFNVTGMPLGVFVADIRQGAASVFDEGFVVDGNANPVQVVLDTGGVQITGVVVNAERKPVSGANVVLVPAASRRQNALLYRNKLTDENGRFAFDRRVPPGSYTLYAWESALPTSWRNAEFLANYEGRGLPLVVESQSKPELEVPLIPIP